MLRDGELRKIFREHLPAVHWQSVETGGTGRGVPDLNGCYNGNEVWIENKSAVGFRVLLRPEQVAWLERRDRAGGRTFIAVRKGKDALYLFPGRAARLLLRNTLRTLPSSLLGTWKGLPSAWNWVEISDILFGNKITETH